MGNPRWDGAKTLAKEAKTTEFLLQNPDIIPPELSELLSVNQKSSILGIILRTRDGVDVASKSDKYPVIDDWMVTEVKQKPDPFKAKEDKQFISENSHLIPVQVASLLRPNVRRMKVAVLQ